MTNPFDAKAHTWDDSPARVQRAAERFAALERRVPLQSDWAALDYGCGTGLLALSIAPRVRRLTAVDSSRGMLDVLARKADAAGVRNVVLLQADFADGPHPPGPYDLIVSSMALHHVADVPRLLRTFSGMLGQGSTLAIIDLDAEDGSFHGETEGIAHLGFRQADFAQWLADAGFANVEFSEVYRIPKNGRDYPLFLAVATKP
jgi:cyclopropane fatty-acyl-phospholipid synthase-like methyltransferase